MLAALVACEKEASVADTDAPAKKQVTITASIPEGGLETKVELSQDGSNKKLIKLAWETGDTIDINGETFTIKDATISGDGHSAEFTGTDPGAGPYTISYSDLPGSFTAQTQASDGDTDHLGYSVSLTGADDYQDVTFNSTWASAHSATLAQSSVLSLRALLPAGMAANVRKVIFKASENVFNGGKTLEVTIGTPGDTDSDNLLKVYATLPAGDVVLAADMDLLVQFQVSANAYDKYTAYRKIDSGTTFVQSGSSQYLGINCSNIASYANASTTNIGESTNPYLIGDQHQMDKMHDELVADGTIYFKLVDDVDMTGITWAPLNNSGTYNLGINFDGDEYIISNLTPDNTKAYPSFVGVLNGLVKDVVFDGANVTAGNNTSGVLAGYIGSSGSSVTGNCSGITVKNSSVTGGTKNRLGGIAGLVSLTSLTISDCHVNNVTVSSSADRVGGMFGEVASSASLSNCTAIGVDVEGNINIGGLAGVGYGNFTNCSSTGSISSTNITSNVDIGLGGLVGYFETGTISKCHSSVAINQTTNGRDIGGLVGKMLAGTIEKSYATGNVTGQQRNVGGLVGLVTLTSGTARITNCYETGGVNANAYSGGLIGLHEKGTLIVSNCYSTGSVNGSFGLGGIVGYAAAASLTMGRSVAWNGSITAASIEAANWSSGAVVGVTFPTCALSDNYRNPEMALTAYWGTETGYTVALSSGYQHADVSSTHPLVNKEGAETTAVSLAKGQPDYPLFPYHGKCETGKTLSQLASTTLGWSSEIWDFSVALPTLK